MVPDHQRRRSRSARSSGRLGAGRPLRGRRLLGKPGRSVRGCPRLRSRLGLLGRRRQAAAGVKHPRLGLQRRGNPLRYVLRHAPQEARQRREVGVVVESRVEHHDVGGERRGDVGKAELEVHALAGRHRVAELILVQVEYDRRAARAPQRLEVGPPPSGRSPAAGRSARARPPRGRSAAPPRACATSRTAPAGCAARSGGASAAPGRPRTRGASRRRTATRNRMFSARSSRRRRSAPRR